jgi:AcrR family transcriptional regulator
MGIAERKRREFAHREQVILGAALSLFDSDHWLSVTVDQIAEKAEVGKGTVYTHFPGKAAIYARLTLDFYYGLLEELEKVAVEREVVPMLREIFIVSLRYHARQPEFRRVTQYCKRIDFKNRASAEIREAFNNLDARFRKLTGDLFSRGIANNEIPETSITHLHYCMRVCFDGSVDTIWTGYIGLEKIDIEEYMDVITNFMIAGVIGMGNIQNRQTSSLCIS